MKKAIIGKKVGMTQIFDETGKVIPVTVIEAGHCVVVQKMTTEKEGYKSVQLGYEEVAEEQKARLAALAAVPDDELDYSDISPLPDIGWVKAVEELQAKRQITLRIDADVIDFFKDSGTRYQTRMNAVLRSYMNAHKKT